MTHSGYQLLITAGAQADLRGCKDQDRYAAALIATHLRELRNDPGRCACLIDEQYFDEVIQDVEPVWSLQRIRLNAYRIKFVMLGGWRVITGADHRSSRVAILAVMPRGDDYQQNQALWARIEREYDELDFPRLGR